jgi:hypothetical protein
LLFFNNLEISDVLTGSRGLARVKLIDSIQVSHLHVARHGSAFMPDRVALKLLAQKEATHRQPAHVSAWFDWVGTFDAGFFVTGEAREGASEGAYM